MRPRFERPLLGPPPLGIVDSLFGRVDVDHPPDDAACEHLPQRLRRLEAVAGRDRHSPSRDLLRAELAEATLAEGAERLVEQPTQFLGCLRLCLVLGEVLIDELAQRDRAAETGVSAKAFERPLEGIRRVTLGSESAPLDAP